MGRKFYGVYFCTKKALEIADSVALPDGHQIIIRKHRTANAVVSIPREEIS